MTRYLAILLCIVFSAGCASGPKFKAEQLVNITINMSKDDVRSALGNPSSVRQAVQTKEGGIIEIWEYIEKASFWKGGTEKAYAVYFKDGRVYKWGRPKDWIYKP